MVKYVVALKVEFLTVSVEASSVQEAREKAIKGEWASVEPIAPQWQPSVKIHLAGKAPKEAL